MGKNVVWNVHSLLGEMQSDTKERRQHLKQKPFEQNNGQLAGMLHRVKPIVILCSILNVKAKLFLKLVLQIKRKAILDISIL